MSSWSVLYLSIRRQRQMCIRDRRNTEGSGLGLSIARSLTELQGGDMKIDIDGDLFKATLKFDLINDLEVSGTA